MWKSLLDCTWPHCQVKNLQQQPNAKVSGGEWKWGVGIVHWVAPESCSNERCSEDRALANNFGTNWVLFFFLLNIFIITHCIYILNRYYAIDVFWVLSFVFFFFIVFFLVKILVLRKLTFFNKTCLFFWFLLNYFFKLFWRNFYFHFLFRNWVQGVGIVCIDLFAEDSWYYASLGPIELFERNIHKAKRH